MFKNNNNQTERNENYKFDMDSSFINPHPCSSNRCGKCVTCCRPRQYKPHEFVNESNKKVSASKVSTWDEEQVYNWLIDNDLYVFVTGVNRINGALLEELYLLKNEAPDYFYSKLDKDMKVPLKDILNFTLKLKQLFTSK